MASRRALHRTILTGIRPSWPTGVMPEVYPDPGEVDEVALDLEPEHAELADETLEQQLAVEETLEPEHEEPVEENLEPEHVEPVEEDHAKTEQPVETLAPRPMSVLDHYDPALLRGPPDLFVTSSEKEDEVRGG